MISNSMLSFGISAVEVFLGLYFLELGFREDFIGTYYAVSTGTSAVLLLAMGRLSDRIGRIASFYATLFGHLTGYMILFFYQTPAAIFLCGFLNGASAALRACTSSPFLHENARASEREYVFSASSSYLLIGSMLGSVAGGYMPVLFLKFFHASGSFDAYRYSVTAASFFILASIWPLFYMKESSCERHAAGADNYPVKRSGVGNRRSFNEPEGPFYYKFVIYTFLIGCGAGLIVPFFNVYFAQKFSMDSSRIGIIFMAGNILTAVLMMITPVITERVGKINSIAVMEILSLPFLLILGFSSSAPLCIAAYFIRGALMNMNNPVFMNIVMELTPDRERGRVSSIVTLGDNFSRTISTYVSGRIMTNHGVSLPYSLTAAFYSLAAAYIYISFARYEKKK